MKIHTLLLLSLFLFPQTILAKDLFSLNGKININTADAEDFTMLPFVGKKRARKIVEYRKKRGQFREKSDLLSVQGVGKEVFAAINKYIKVRGENSLRYAKSKEPAPGTTIIINSYKGPVTSLENRKYFYLLMDKIREAKKSIIVCIYVFKTSEHKSNLANKVLQGLQRAARKGVDVTVLMEKNNIEGDRLNEYNESTAVKLRSAGVEVFFDQKDINTHSKLIIIDEKRVFLGSHNLTHTALSKSNETSVLIESDELAKELTAYVTNILKKGKMK